MQESTGRESSNKENNGEQDGAGSDSEATSEKTLSDLEENEADVEPGSSKSDPSPSPDGAFDESEETTDAGPM